MAASIVGKATSFTSCPRTFLRAWRSSRCRVALLSTDNNDPSADVTPEKSEQSTVRDPFPLFASTQVQSLLLRITGFDVMKAAGPHLKPMTRPVYKLLTDAELKEEQDDAQGRLKHRLQMPPYMTARKPVLATLVDDPDLAGFDTSKYVFVDCSFGLKDRHRSVVVRDTDGSLSEASWDTKERVNQIFNPREGRSVVKPKMFEEQNLEVIIQQKKYVYILNRACAQFEPDDPDFIRTSHRIYNAVSTAKDFESLRSTRFFGPLAFYLCWHKTCDSLMVDILNRDLLGDAGDLVQLYCLIHPDGKCAESLKSVDQTNDLEAVLKAFIETEASLTGDLKNSLQALLDRMPKEGKSVQQSSS